MHENHILHEFSARMHIMFGKLSVLHSQTSSRNSDFKHIKTLYESTADCLPVFNFYHAANSAGAPKTA